MKIKNYDNYDVYEDGRIYSYKRNKFLKPQTRPNGYQQVKLVDNEGNAKWHLVHRVVWEAFSGEPIPSGMQINHIDEKKDNNIRSNLELVSPKQNINYGSRNSRAAKAISKQVGAFKNNELVMTFPSTREAHRQGFCQADVGACCRNCFNRPGNNIYKGYEWRYI